MSTLKETLATATKDAMKAREKARLATLRLINAEIKRVEVDERIELDDARILALLDKMTKQRRDSIAQYEKAGRPELAEVEQQEINVIQDFLPEQLSEAEIQEIVAAAVKETGAASMADMGKVMALVKPQVQGRADMGAVSKLVKASF
ncbi:GatB/YqeY domain-containing protein [Microbulbifer agarilyticus]|uniref:GatB/YqeY domain-containing protein n=1 Tax=Microbulbifer agarilyticus TaxID=260552 RepID=UPI001C96A856|nr:GatB/YqeY domain-containing protein [Microbulbifer agarilyticus]MBY6190073.1 GatB/YqeY domain-containing protein [Microbulbifer agarilyticus]MBY6210075.1 GatB/YqeY domain-containing protein [Microbulbifer agarilyticus]MCA0892564.1 GatB/YqeY domain-containing protein [Microbulbifer agarilyticus]MCA0899728.1 GatB/YqeY domain-containing protein [Microbulbifer agarilyticus]